MRSWTSLGTFPAEPKSFFFNGFFDGGGAQKGATTMESALATASASKTFSGNNVPSFKAVCKCCLLDLSM